VYKGRKEYIYIYIYIKGKRSILMQKIMHMAQYTDAKNNAYDANRLKEDNKTSQGGGSSIR
jgi:hypothetical protein